MDPIQKADATTEDYLKRSHCVFPTREELRALVLIALGPTVSSVVVELLSSLPLGWCFPLRPGELKMSSLSLLFPLYRSSIQPKALLIISLIPNQEKNLKRSDRGPKGLGGVEVLILSKICQS